jgi:hypothetical protein
MLWKDKDIDVWKILERVAVHVMDGISACADLAKMVTSPVWVGLLLLTRCIDPGVGKSAPLVSEVGPTTTGSICDLAIRLMYHNW